MEALPYILALAAVLALTARGLWRRQPWALGLAWCFLILAPSSSFLAIRDPAFEHRMYAPLAGLIFLGVLLGYRILHRIFGGWRGFGAAALAGVAGMTMVLVGLTLARNADYGSEVSIWRDTAEKRPENARAWFALSSGLLRKKKVLDAEKAARRALAIQEDLSDAWINLAMALKEQSRFQESSLALEECLQMTPDDYLIHCKRSGGLYASSAIQVTSVG